ncbi:MAG TPA: recombinase family protein, partial [candidate division Zixibacteria bacterium]|nr:recombinase family protein [candidate division Zixibacteria bacterium]
MGQGPTFKKKNMTNQTNQASEVAIYTRKSTESEDRQVLSIESQIRELKDYAQSQGLKVSSVHSESRSAKSPGRPIFSELITQIQKGKIRGILCWKLDRLSRNPVDGGALIWAMEEGHLKAIHTPQSSFFNSGNDKFWMQLEFGMAKKYVDDLSDNVKRGIKSRVIHGWAPGVPPLGYQNDKANKTIVKDEIRFPLVRKMWDLLLTGNYTPNLIVSISNKEWGLTSRRFNRIGGGAIGYSTIYKLFTNPFYFGKIQHKGLLYDGSHVPMISFAEFEKAQEILMRRTNPRPKKIEFAYTGLITCGECGASITAENKVNKYGRRYVYYHCTKRKGGVKCLQRVIEQKTLEDQIISFLQSITISNRLKEWATTTLRELDEEENTYKSTKHRSRQSRILGLKNELNQLINMKMRLLISDEEFTQKRNELFLHKQRLENQQRSDNRSASNSARDVFDFATRVEKAFKIAAPNIKREILRQVGSNFILMNKILNIHAHKPLNEVRNFNLNYESQFARFELQESSSTKAKDGLGRNEFITWRGRVKEVRTFFETHPDCTL